ncbi:MAG: VOC family protein [Roseiarcus sp.]
MNVIKPALHHATMRTSHLDEMVAWYGRVIGARVTFRNEHAAWTTNDEANHRVAFLAVPGLSDDAQKVSHNGLHHLAFEYGSFDDLMSSYKRLADEAITPSFCLDHGMTVSLYYRDPEANYVELQCDCFDDWKHSREWMENSADFAANPIGVFFDPAEVFEAHRSGADFDTLHRAMRGGEHLPERIPNIGLPE